MFHFLKKEIIPEALTAYKWRLPDSLKVSIKSSRDGGYVVIVENLPGCVTQAENGSEIFDMVNDAVYTYFDIPARYQPYLPAYLPSEEQRKKYNIAVPVNEELVLQRV